MKTVCPQNNMEELKQILAQHANRYPLMEPTDAVKLIYQNEFGGGHLIRDEASCLHYLQAEYEAVEKRAGAPKTEEIGNGIVRVNLGPLSLEELEQLGRAFILSAQAHKGSMELFRRKLESLREAAKEGLFSFDLAALDGYLAAYCDAGCPMVSHSEQFRSAYRPAYRIVRKEYLAER